jgi:hypothetical protein
MSYLVFSHQAWAEVSGATCSQKGDLWFCYQLQTARSCGHMEEEIIAQKGGPPGELQVSTWSHLCPHRTCQWVN